MLTPAQRVISILALRGRQSMSEEETKKTCACQENTGHDNGQRPISLTPLRLLEVILKIVLKDRITNEEVKRICSTYFKTIEDLWG